MSQALSTPDPELSELQIEGMTCASCVRRIEKAVKKIPGVDSVSVNFATERARIVREPQVSEASLIAAIKRAGYDASPHVQPDTAARVHQTKPNLELVVSTALTLSAIAISMALPMRSEAWNWVLFGLATPVIFVFGRHFFASAWASLRHGIATMDTLVAMGSGVAWAASLYGLLLTHGPMQSDHIYFETGATIVTLILFGRSLETRAKRTMSDAIGKLLDLSPKLANRVETDGFDLPVPAESLLVGDLVRIKPGERAPVDGTVISGESFFDESLLTGESMPAWRTEGDRVTGGSVNGSGSVVCRVERVVQDSRPAQIARLVEQAQGSKAPIQDLADRISAVFVPAVLLVALASFGWRFELLHLTFEASLLPAIAILVIACPCALGLATPTAIVVGTGRGAALGVLIRDGSTLQLASEVKTVLLDKTGTITDGRPKVTSIRTEGGLSEQRLMSIAAALESGSEHPLAKSITEHAREHGAAVIDSAQFSASAGRGVEATIEGHRWRAGTLSFTGSSSSSFTEALAGSTRIYLSCDGVLAGTIDVRDPVRSSSAAVVSELTSLGLATVMLTGDAWSTASAVASQVGIHEVEAEVLPEEKAAVVAKYLKQGPVAMVGDGVNDAPALAAASVGIAMGAGADIAKAAAGITLLRNDLSALPTALRLARRTTAVIRGNLVWAFGYNVVAIPVAASGHLNPMIAAGAMALSSLSVVLNSLRLRRFS